MNGERACLDCERVRLIQGRGLCGACYARRVRAGTLDERPPVSPRGPAGGVDSLLSAGLSYRQLDYWVRRGYLRPVNATDGSGSVRDWPESERRVAELMARLVKAGLTVEAAHRVARAGGSTDLAPGVRVEVAA